MGANPIINDSKEDKHKMKMKTEVPVILASDLPCLKTDTCQGRKLLHIVPRKKCKVGQAWNVATQVLDASLNSWWARNPASSRSMLMQATRRVVGTESSVVTTQLRLLRVCVRVSAPFLKIQSALDECQRR